MSDELSSRPPQVLPAVVYLTDDLSGATSAASLLYEAGLRQVVVLEHDHLARAQALGAQGQLYQVYIVDVAGRDVSEREARRRLLESVGLLKERLGGRRLLWGKRLDSTLRGHVAAELRALGEMLPELGPALVAPAFPQAGRSTVGGYQLVRGVPAGDVDGAARSHLPSLLAGAGYRALHTLGLQALRARAPLAGLGRDEALVADAAQGSDLATLARLTLPLWLEGALVVDSGPYLAQLARAALARGLWPEPARVSPLLVVLGSRSALTERQVAHLRAAQPGVCVGVCVGACVLEAGAGRGEALEARAGDAEVVVLLADATRAIDEALAALAATAARLLQTLPPPHALIVSGGRTASSLLAALQAQGLDFSALAPRGEALPLVPVSRFSGGAMDGSLLLTKGGLVGDETTLARIVDILKLLRRFA